MTVLPCLLIKSMQLFNEICNCEANTTFPIDFASQKLVGKDTTVVNTQPSTRNTTKQSRIGVSNYIPL